MECAGVFIREILFIDIEQYFFRFAPVKEELKLQHKNFTSVLKEKDFNFTECFQSAIYHII